MSRVMFVALAALAGTAPACGGSPEEQRLKATVKATYDPATGRLARLTADLNKDGTIDTYTYMDGTRVLRSEIPSEQDETKIDRWEWYEGDRLVRAEEDASGDGRVDKWEEHRAGALAAVMLDEDYDGTPDRRLLYGESGRLVAIESDPDGRGGFRKRVAVESAP